MQITLAFDLPAPYAEIDGSASGRDKIIAKLASEARSGLVTIDNHTEYDDGTVSTSIIPASSDAWATVVSVLAECAKLIEKGELK